MKQINRLFLFLVPCALYLISCTTIDLYEKSVSIPGHSWISSYKPSFTFTIKDTTSPYQLFFILRHNDQYSFNNIYINLYVKQPGQDSAKAFRCDLRLATDADGWLASGMDDIYEHRIDLNKYLIENDISLRKKGDYTFSIEQIMRENPLNNVLNAGLRIEKKQ